MSVYGRSVYLHFLDRELGESIGYQSTTTEVQKSLQLLTLVAGASLNCGASLLFESPAISSSSSLFNFCKALLSSGWLQLISSHPTIPEFLESRALLYSHDRLRYPMYFDRIPSLPNRINILSKSTSATNSLVRSLSDWGHDTEKASDRDLDAKKAVIESLTRREDRAVTAAIFAAASASSIKPKQAIGVVRRRISNDYTRHFMNVLDSDIATGMYGLDYFDAMSARYPYYDVPILLHFSRLVGLYNVVDSAWEGNSAFWDRFLHTASTDSSFQAYLDEVSILFNALHLVFKSTPILNFSSFRTRVTQTFDRLSTYFSAESVKIDQDLFLNILLRTQNVISHLEKSPELKSMISSVRMERQMSNSWDILLLVATDVELNAVLARFSSAGNQATVRLDGGRAFYDLGYLNGRRIALVKVEMGTSSIGGSTTTTLRMVDHLSPKCVIMVGIAFGVDQSKQSIGDVLISRQVLAYDLQRVGTGVQGELELRSRGDKTSAHPTLVSLLQATASLWSEARVSAGLILSGDKLVDNIDFREQIKVLAGGEAIGGEMEGTGLILAAAETSTPWIIVKAICDWADGKKSHMKKVRQERAANNAVSFVFRALQVEAGDGSAF